MKIAILSCFYPYRGGISQFNAALFEELGKGSEVKAFNFKRQYPDFLFPGKTQYVTADDQAVAVPSTAVLDTVNPLTFFTTAHKIAAWKPDLVIVRYWMSWFAPSLGFVTRYLRRRGIKVISILDNVIPHEQHFFDKIFNKYFLGGSDAHITLCDAVAKDLLELKPGVRYCVIPHPLYSHFGDKLPKESALKALGLDPGKKTLLFFGLIREYKGLDILLDAFAMLDESYQLIIAGEPYGSFDRYQQQLDSLGIGGRTSCTLSYIKDSEVSAYFSGAELCVLPYRSATQSGVSAISFHFEVPMLVTDVGGLKETIADKGTGILASDITPEAVKEGIERYFSDEKLRENCIENIRKEKERLSWHNFAKQLLDFYKTL